MICGKALHRRIFTLQDQYVPFKLNESKGFIGVNGFFILKIWKHVFFFLIGSIWHGILTKHILTEGEEK